MDDTGDADKLNNAAIVKEINIANTEIIVRKATVNDIYQLSNWGKYSDIRFYGYNFPELGQTQAKYWLNKWRWFIKRSVPFLRWVYVVEDSSKCVIGYLKAVKKGFFDKRAELSIVLDPALIQKGYGYKALNLFLEECFYDLKIEEMWLRVVDHNGRARRLYEKVGFKYYEVRKEPFDDQNHNCELLEKHPNDFFMDDNVLMSKFHYMCINKTDFESLKNDDRIR